MRLPSLLFDKTKLIKGLIITAIVFSPFTQLRVGLVGIPEACAVILILAMLFSKNIKTTHLKLKNFVFAKFWFVFIILSSLGLVYNYLILSPKSGSVNSMIFDGSTYIFVGLACFSIEVLFISNKNIDIWDIIKKIYIILSLLLLILYLISIKTDSIFGFSLNYYQYFCPFADNIHQVAMIITPLPFIGLKIISMKTSIMKKSWILLLVFSNIVTGISTGSVKFYIGLIIGILFCAYIWAEKLTKNTYIKAIYFLLTILPVLIVYIVLKEQIDNSFVSFFSQNDIGGARILLWSSSVRKILISPIFGYGPGAHINEFSNIYSDAHQTFLTVALQGGLFALMGYVLMHYKIFKSCINHPHILSAYIGILLYALGGDILRRLPMWIFLIIFYFYSTRYKSKLDC